MSHSIRQSQSLSPSDFLAGGGGEMGARIREKDWSRTSLGHPESWPRSLRGAIRLMLSSRYPMFVWWGRELINFYNDAYIPVLGARHPDALGRPASGIWHEVWHELGPQAELVLNEGKATWNEELLLVMERNGYTEETYFTFSYSPVLDDDGGAGGVFCACTEDTVRVLGERRVGVLRQLSTSVLDAETVEQVCERSAETLGQHSKDISFALIYLLSGGEARLAARSGIESGNEYASDRLLLDSVGSAPAEWPLKRVLSGETAVLSGLQERSLPGGLWPEPTSTVLILPLLKKGQEQPNGFLIAGASPRRAFDDSYRGFFELMAQVIGSAISNARAYEEERKRAQALAELDRAKTVFFSNVSHEFRTPLTLLLGPLEEMLAKSREQPLEHHGLLQVAHRNGLRLHKLVNTLLDFSRIEAGRASATFEPCDLSALTADLASTFRSSMEKAGIRLEVDCPPLPEPVYVDREMWEKIVLNFLSNAFKFTLDGTVTVSVRPSGEHVELTVSDTGIGIPERELPHIFERFHRVEGAKGRTFEGTGIGLALVQELVKLHGGFVRVESQEGKGSEFSAFIPRGASHISDDVGSGRPALSSTAARVETYLEEALGWLPGNPRAASLAAGRRVLLADDNADMREYVGRLLGERYQVTVHANGEEALRAALDEPPDLVLADVMMPVLDGFQLLKRLRAHPNTANIPVILLSARAGEESQVEGLEAGADDYLVKPFTARELLARVNAHLEMHRRRKNAEEAVQRSDAKLRLVTNAVPALISFIGSDYRYQFVNRTYEEWFGIPHGSVAGMLVADVLGSEAFIQLRPHMARAMSGETVVYEDWIPYKTGARYIRASYVPEFLNSGEVSGFAVLVEDLSDRKRSEEALRQANADLEQFAHSASHDLREPLRTVAIYSELLGRRYSEAFDAQGKQFLDCVIQASVRMQMLIRDLLVYTEHIGAVERDAPCTDAEDALKRALGNLDASIQAADALVTHDPLPQVKIRPVHLQQIVQNLIGNAIKYRGESRPRVHISAERKEGDWLFSVRDNGIGIDPKYHRRIFGLFKRLHAADKYSGTGIGLALCERIVERYGGRIWVESEEGKGADFRFTVPGTGD